MAKDSDAHAAVAMMDYVNPLHGLVAARLREARFEVRHSLLKKRYIRSHSSGQADWRPASAASVAK
jgi:hypothetical protein